MREVSQLLDAFFSALMFPVFYLYYPLVLISLIYVGRMNFKKEGISQLRLRALSLSIVFCSFVYCALTALLLYQSAGYALITSIYLGPAFLLGLVGLYLIHKNKILVRLGLNGAVLTREAK